MRKNILTLACAAALTALGAASAFAQSWSDLQTSTDEALLIQAIEKPGDEPEDIHTKNVACKRLAVYGTQKSIPALAAMLANEKQNFNARFALEAMPFPEVDAALAEAAQKLDGACLVGVIDTIGVRNKPESVALLIEIGKKTSDPAVQKAVYAALGAIATDDAVAYLTEAAKADLAKFEFVPLRGLADAILDVAQLRETRGETAKAAELYKVVAGTDAFPKFAKEAGLYRALLCDGAASADKVVELLKGDDASAADVALKTLREFKPEASDAVTAKVLAAFNELPAASQIEVVRAFAKLQGEKAFAEAAAKAAEIAKGDNLDLAIAAAKTAKESANGKTIAIEFPVETLLKSEELRNLFADYKAAVARKNNGAGIDVNAIVADKDEITLMNLRAIEEARVKSAGSKLVEIAETKTGAVRDAALSALSEIVELSDLELLVRALNGETDDQKVDWLLRAACTRMPREECAAKVAEIFEKSNLEQKIKTLPLLKQIGGSAALAAVAAACNNPQTVDKATQILGEWNTPEDANQLATICLAIAKQSNDAKYLTRGIRGYIRVARQFELPVAQKIDMCKTAYETAKRIEDKNLIFEVFKRNITAENVAAALEYVKYPESKEAACEAAVYVAEKIRTSQPAWNWKEKSGDEARDAAAKILVDGMKKVAETSGNADLRGRAEKLL